MSNAAYRMWHETEWWQESYEKLWAGGAAVGLVERGSETLLQEEDGTRKADETEEA